SEPVAPAGTFTYTFTVTEAGTFWYHPHFDTDHQVSRGLYGAFIVEDPTEPVPDEDLLLVISDWYLGEEAESTELLAGDHQAAEGTWTVNGQVQPTLTVAGGSTLRVRAINVSNHSYLDLRWPDIRLLGTDQGIGSALSQPEGVLLSSGDRMEAEWLIGEEGFSLLDAPYVHQGGTAWGEPEVLMAVEVSAPASAPAGLSWPFSGLEPSEDPGQTDITYVFTGSRESGVWLMNGAVFPDVDIDTVDLGNSAIIEVRNLSPAEHPYHLHGMHFEVLSIDGVPPAGRQVEDTINVGIYSVVRLRLVADNPGDWMSHCHILPHAEGGMMTVLRVNP
ncbi:MAG: FtsP/CotA-like multicopper oxidase with cupredoxin domain, partial [Myxococcota bacterium]